MFGSHSFKTLLAAGALVLMAGGASAAPVTLAYDFTNGSVSASDSLGYTQGGVGLTVTGFLYTAPQTINANVKVNQQNNNGLGVCGTWVVGNTGNCAGPLLDGGAGVNDNELLKFSFSKSVELVSIAFRQNDQNDPFDLFLGEPLVFQAAYPMPGPPSRVYTFAEPYFVGSVFGIGLQGNSDQGRIAGFTVRYTPAVVPLPAAGFLLIGALGGLAALRRRRRAA